MTARLRAAYFPVAAVFLLAVVVQFFLAGLAVFDPQVGFGPHVTLGHVTALVALVLVVLAVAGRLPRPLPALTVLLFALNVLQIVLAAVRDQVPQIAALHVVNALVIFVLAHALMRRARGDAPPRAAV